MNSQRIKVVLNPDKEDDRRILDYLLYAGEPMSKVFKAAMLQYVEEKYEAGKHEKLLRDIRKVVHEELQQIRFCVNEPYSQPVPQSSDEEEVSPLDFLDQLAEMATF